MTSAAGPSHVQKRRLEALKRYDVVDAPAPAEFDHLVRLAATIFSAPIAIVSFVAEDRQLLKARVGIDACETTLERSICYRAIQDGTDLFVVADAAVDERVRSNPAVTSAPFVRFYAGAPLLTPCGQRIGMFCIVDMKPRPLWTDRDGEILKRLAGLAMDHLERRRLQSVKRSALKMATCMADALVGADDNGNINFWNAGAEALFGFARQDAMGRPMTIVVPKSGQRALRANLKRVRTRGRVHLAGKPIEVVGQRSDGSQVPIEISISVWKDRSRRQVAATIRDVSDRIKVRERMDQLANFDPLTHLPNRVRFLEEIQAALGGKLACSVLKIGLDRFKDVNGSIGMAAGDLVLQEAAQRVRLASGLDCFVARLGADEFGVLLRGVADPLRAADLATRIGDALAEPFVVLDHIVRLSASAGIVAGPRLCDFEDASTVLRGALLALHRAKREGGRTFEIFRPQLGHEVDNRLRLIDEMRQALAREEFEVFLQPQVRLPDGAIIGAEALLRWRHPERGLLTPAAFLPLLETTDFAKEVGSWVMRRACAIAGRIPARRGIRMGVNLFAAQLRDPDFERGVLDALSAGSLQPHLLELELTETTVLRLDDSFVAPLRRLRDFGIGIAFDDYGTGFASLSLLKRYPLTRLKIDREFVRDIETDPDDAAIVRAVLAMGASLGFGVIAEGIETAEQALLLSAFGCREGQGYRFGRPMEADRFLARLAEGEQEQATVAA